MLSRSYPFSWVVHSNLSPGALFWYWQCLYSPETQLPLKRRGVNSCPSISFSWKRWPLTLGPSSGGVSSTTDVTINASTMTMTSNAIRIPRQFRWLGLLDTNCWHKGKPIRHVKVVTESAGSLVFKYIQMYFVVTWQWGRRVGRGKFSLREGLALKSSRMWRCVFGFVVFDVSKHRVFTSQNSFTVRSVRYYRKVEGNISLKYNVKYVQISRQEGDAVGNAGNSRGT